VLFESPAPIGTYKTSEVMSHPTRAEDRTMPASAAQIAANQRNSKLAKGPVTEQGRAQSRKNSLKHGLTGQGVVLPNEDAAEVERRLAAFQEELKPSGEVGKALVRRAALMSVRMDRCVEQETAALSERVRKAEADFVAPEGVDPEEAARLRAEAGRRAMFDPSKEATLARKYEAAAERGFFRALKELRQLEKQIKAADPVVQAEAFREELGSFLSLDEIDADLDRMEAKLDREEAELAQIARSKGVVVAPSPFRSAPEPRIPASGGSFDLPFTIGRPR
jgi:hypothetical protein